MKHKKQLRRKEATNGGKNVWDSWITEYKIYFVLLLGNNSHNKLNGNTLNVERPSPVCAASNILVRLPQYSQDRKSYSEVDTDEDCSEVDVIGDDKGYLS